MRAKYVVIGVVLGILLSSAVVVLAGNLDPPSGPADAASQMYTLEQIYDRLDTGAEGTKMTSFSEPASGPGTGTMRTLNDIYDLIGPPAPVPQTGQTGCWTDTGTEIDCTGTGQDGEYRKNVAWPYPRFTGNGDRTVTDNLTGLVWLKDASCPDSIGLSSYTDYLNWASKLHDGCTDCGGTDGDCGLSDGSEAGDWRLPNINELQSLVAWNYHDPAVPNTAGTGQWTENLPFHDVESSWYWTSTTVVNAKAYVWIVNMDSGLVGSSAKNTGSRNAWPVRDGP